jgi:hypothetical protein
LIIDLLVMNQLIWVRGPFFDKSTENFFFGPGMKTVQPIENERKSNQPMND